MDTDRNRQKYYSLAANDQNKNGVLQMPQTEKKNLKI